MTLIVSEKDTDNALLLVAAMIRMRFGRPAAASEEIFLAHAQRANTSVAETGKRLPQFAVVTRTLAKIQE